MTSQTILDSRYSWLRLVLTVVVAVFANIGIWMIVVIMPDIEADFGASRAWVSMPYTLTMVGFAAGNFLVGRLMDKFGVTLCLQGAAIVSALGFGLSALAPNIYVLSALHVLLGLGTAIGFGPLMADISHWFYRNRGFAVALVASGNYLAGAVWPLVLSSQITAGDWRGVYFSLVWVSLALIPLAYTLRRKLPEEAHKVAATDAAARAATTGLSPRALMFLLGFAGIGCCVAMSMPQVHIVTYCVGLGFGPIVGQQMLMLILMGGVVSRLISGVLTDKLGGVRILLIGSLAQCFSLFLFLGWNGLVPLYAISLIFGLSQGGIVPAYTVIVREYMPPREAGARVGFVIMMTVFGMALGGWMSGWIYDLSGSYWLAFVNGIIWNLGNIAIALWLIGRTRRGTPDAQPA